MLMFYWNWAYKYSDHFQMNVSYQNGYPEKELMQQNRQKYLYIVLKILSTGGFHLLHSIPSLATATL